MVKRVFTLLLFGAANLVSLQLFAAVSAQLSAQNIDELETVRLTIKITETRQTQTLDLSALEKDFHIMNTNTVSQSRFRNGRGQSWVDYQITLQPKRTGSLAIPSIAVGNELTPSLELKVRPLSAQTRRKIDELVFFENEVSAQEIYVQSQLILTRRLLYSQGVQLYSDLPGAPEIADAVVLTLGETSSGTTERNGNTYGVVQQRYAIFPETSGTFTVPGISITASVRLVENNRVSRKGVRVGTPDELITVLPVPASYPRDEPWLPANKVTLFDVVSPERGSHAVGDTLTHELLVHIEGNIGSIAPPLGHNESDANFRIYPQAPAIEDDTSGSIVKGSRLQTNSIVPLQPGRLALPTSRLVWWDTVSKEVRVSSTQPLAVSVTGAAIAPVAPAPAIATQQARDPDATDRADAGLTWPALRPYLIVVAAAALVGLALLLARRYRRHLRALWVRPPNTHRLLQRAFDNLDRAEILEALGAHLADYFRCPRHAALGRFSATNAEAAAVLERLNRALYAAAPQAPDNEDIAADVQVLRRAVRRLGYEPATASTDPLPELYAPATSSS